MEKSNKQVVRRFVMGASLLVATMTACGSADETGVMPNDGTDGANVPSDQASPEWYRHRPRATGGAAGQGGAASTGGAAATTGGTASSITYDCSICDQANVCCDAVTPDDRPACSFSTNECLSYSSPDSQKNYALYCLTFIRTVITAWQPKSPPASCLLPN